MPRYAFQKEDILQLREQGYSISKIATIYGCSETSIRNRLSDNLQPIHKVNCPICGIEYTYIGKKVKNTCGKHKCRVEFDKNRIKDGSKSEEVTPYGLIREYTEASNIMIVQDLQKGLSIKQMARLYKRDPNDLQQHIEQIIKDGTVGRIKRMLSLYQKYNTLPQRSGLL